MKIYGSPFSPFVRHCRIALIESGMDWEMVEIDAVASAEQSPVKKVPFLHDGDMRLTDSCSILKYVREKSDRTFFSNLQDYELFCMTNTTMDATLNLFLMENDGLGPEQSNYLKRQSARVESGLDELDSVVSQRNITLTDGMLRLACFLEWALFRNRINLDSRPNLKEVLDVANQHPAFASTAPN